MDEISGKEFSVSYTTGTGLADWLSSKWNRRGFFGGGEIEFAGTLIRLRGLRRTWLGVTSQDEASVRRDNVQAAWQEGSRIEFVEKRPWRLSRVWQFRARNDADAITILHLLPQTPSTTADVRDFQRRLRATGRHAIVTPILVLLCVAVYLALVWSTRVTGSFDVGTLQIWGGNFGPATTNGQWWRLITYTFLHTYVLHIVISMWVLWNVGRLTEKLYGNIQFAAIYFFSGIVGGLLSIAWDPARLTVGASGAIFGVFGALLASLWRGRAQMPRSIFRTHWISTLVFCLFSILNGAFEPAIDNSCHVGGLIAGLLLGFGLTRPLEQRRWVLPGPRSATALGCSLALMGGLLWFAGSVPQTQIDKFLAAHRWYSDGETPNLILWQQLAGQAAAGTISGLALSDQFEQRILPFWRKASDRLEAGKNRVPFEQRAFEGPFRHFVEVKRQWAQAIIDLGQNPSVQTEQRALGLMQEADTAEANVERLEMRSNMEHRAHALIDISPFSLLRGSWFRARACVEYPVQGMNLVASTDARDDGPAIRHALGCKAQRLFLDRDFPALETLLISHQDNIDDLPDGSSSLEAILGGLDDLFSYGGLTIDQMMDSTTEWRRTYPKSLYPELAETSVLMAWAYQARGFGYANTISNQNAQLFSHRLAMAQAALQSIASRGAASPIWYEQLLSVRLLQSSDKRELRGLFDRGIAQFPGHLALYDAMLHVLMPRWLGSIADVDSFIADQAKAAPTSDRSFQLYALLFSMYSAKEGDTVDIFHDMGAKWDAMQWGLGSLMVRYPKTDVFRNEVAKFSCETRDWSEYRLFRRTYPAHYSASVWSNAISIESCDQFLREAKIQ